MKSYEYGLGYGYPGGEAEYGFGAEASNRLVRYKEEWAGVSVSRCFDVATPWAYRRQAQILFETFVRDGQHAIHRMKGGAEEVEPKCVVKPQLAAFYTGHPNPAQTAVGHTLFLELKGIADGFAGQIASQFGAKVAERYPDREAATIQSVAQRVTTALGNRAILEEAARYEGLQSVEQYRIFQASQCTLRFPHLHDIIDAVVLFGDVLPSLEAMNVHPMTRYVFKVLTLSSRPYFDAFARTPLSDFLALFLSWAAELLDSLAPMLPRKEEKGCQGSAGQSEARSRSYSREEEPPYRYSTEPAHHEPFSPEVAPLDEPRPPMLDISCQEDNSLRDAVLAMFDKGPEARASASESTDPTKQVREIAAKAASELQEAALQASGKTTEWEDLREDLIEQQLALNSFTQGPMEGSPTEGRLVEFSMGGEEVGGQLKDRAMELCEDPAAVRKLREEAKPLAEALRRNLYPSEEECPRIEHIHTSGHLDPKRLPTMDVRKAAFRRYRILKEPSPRGKAILLIAADGSGSLSDDQMKMCKLLTAAWLESGHRANVQILAALYHSDDGPSAGSTPLVQWIYHPRKTPVMNPSSAVRAVASLPDKGTGMQSDAISLKYMLDEAVSLAKGNQIYLTLISDCSWNKCFHASKKSSEEEVASVLESFRDKLGQRFHTTLVSLRAVEQKLIDGVVDKKIVIGREALTRPQDAAEDIASYVASCIRERRRLSSRRS